MNMNDYKLSCELHGHSLDVRAVTEGAPGSIVSGSRDKTAKIWHSEGTGYVEGVTLHDHKNFVSAVCVLDDGALICTGSNDSTICVYAVGSVVPLATLRGHTGTVSALAAGLEPNTVVSGSWDKTARVWTVAGFGPSASVAMVGHEAAVWAVAAAVQQRQYVTASADKTIAFWNECAERLRVLKGHTDCVRAVLPLADGGLLSAGNDAVVRCWSADGECVREMHGHGNYIYTMAQCYASGVAAGPSSSSAAASDAGVVVVTGGEDSTVRMWSAAGGQLGDPLALPAQSVWSVAGLRNGDIVTGTSDGVVRVFTRDETRWASEAVREAFNVGVQTRAAEASLELGGMKVNDLPGPESLIEPGTDGQTRIVRHADGKIMCYQWTATTAEWLCLGDVTGAAGGSQQQSGKKLFEGREYDYVFSVDISDTGAPLKLPYNCSEEPWLVAQRFLHTHELPQAYLEQVANFIITNSANRNPSAQSAAVAAASAYADPFTGDGRYIPGSGTGSGGATIQQQMQQGRGGHPNGGSDFVDPFTGASSYRTEAARQESAAQRNGGQPASSAAVGAGRAPQKHFPYDVYTTFDACDPVKVLDKIRDFNSKLTDDSLKVSDECLEKIITFATREPSENVTHVDALQQLLRWPKDILFPVLDIVRLAVRGPAVCQRLLAGVAFLDQIIENVAHAPANQLMAIRCLANMMRQAAARERLDARLGDIVTRCNRIMSGSGNLQIAIATLYLNASVTQLQNGGGNAEVCRQLTEAVLEFLRWTHEPEAFYRAYRTLGNLTCTASGAVTSAQIVSVDEVIERLRDHMSRVQPAGLERLNEVARDLTAAL